MEARLSIGDMFSVRFVASYHPAVASIKGRSDVRILGKVCHLAALAWTALCLPVLITSIAYPSKTEGNAAAIVETKIAFYSLFWFVPAAGLELVAFVLSLVTDKPEAPEQPRKEWRAAGLVMGVPGGLIGLIFLARIMRYLVS